jgi:hypothetical protein
MRKRLMKSFLANEKPAMAAMARRWASTRYVQDMWELLAKLEGELRKDAAENPRGVGLIILNNQGRGRLDPEVFREAARRKALEMSSSHHGAVQSDFDGRGDCLACQGRRHSR